MSIECRHCGNKVHDRDCPKYDLDLSDPPPNIFDRAATYKAMRDKAVEAMVPYQNSGLALRQRMLETALDHFAEALEALPPPSVIRVEQTPEEFEALKKKVAADVTPLSAAVNADEFDRLKAQKDKIELEERTKLIEEAFEALKEDDAMNEKTMEVTAGAKDQDPNRPIVAGDLVRLKGSMNTCMAVEKVVDGNEHDVYCVWLTAKKKVKREQFPNCVLRHN
jgi:hypothetical protein